MARRLQIDIDNKIISAVQEIGGKEGVTKISAQKVALKCGISHFTCFEHFGTVRGMIDEAAMAFDRKYMNKMEALLKDGKTAYEVWDEILDDFIADPNGTLFYNDYVYRFGFDPTHSNKRSTEFLRYAKAFFGDRYADDCEYLMHWDFLTTMAFYYAEKIIHGYIENTPEMRDRIETIVFRGIDLH